MITDILIVGIHEILVCGTTTWEIHDGKLQFLLTVKVHFANDCSGDCFSISPNQKMIV